MKYLLRTRVRVLMLLTGLAFISCGATASAQPLKNIITRQGDQLLDGDQPYRFISFNIPNLLVIEDAFEFTRPAPGVGRTNLKSKMPSNRSGRWAGRSCGRM